MSIDATSFGMLMTTGVEAWQQYEAGEAIDAAYRATARELQARTAYEQRLALEEMKDMHAEGRAVEGQIISKAGKSGLQVGGSVITLTQSIRQKVERRKAMRSFQFQEVARRYRHEAAMYRYMGAQEKYSRRIMAASSLLSGFQDLSQRKEGLGRSWGELFFPKKTPEPTVRTTNPERYYRTPGYGTFFQR